MRAKLIKEFSQETPNGLKYAVEMGNYDIKCETYDSYGNLKKQVFNGLIYIK